MLASRETVRACTAADARRNDNAVADMVTINARTDLLDHARNLMSEDDRRMNRLVPMAEGPEIAAADGARLDLDEEFPRTDHRLCDLLHAHVCRAVVHCCFHSCLLPI